MKKYLIFALSLLCSYTSHAYWDTVRVHTAIEFANALQSDRMIIVEGEGFSLGQPTEYLTEGSNEYLQIQEVYDGKELVVSGLYKLAIIGAGATPVHLYTDPQYGDVIEFKNCNDILIKNIRGGHYPEKGACVGGVFNFQNCQNVTLENCRLYGSGVQGIEASNTHSLTVRNTDIYECVYYIMYLSECSKVRFEDCHFYNNEEFEQINLKDSWDVEFSHCRFTNNRTGSYGSFFSTRGSTIQMSHCTFTENQFQQLSEGGEGLSFQSCTFEKEGKTYSNFSTVRELESMW